MGENSGIQWTDDTWNPVQGCTKVSPACANCYIEDTPPFRIDGRKFDKKGHIPLRFFPERLTIPIRKKRPRLYFVNSLSDLFHEHISDEFIDRVFAAMALSPQHIFQVLTKRPERMHAYFTRSASELRDRWAEALLDPRIFPGDPRAAHLGNPSRAGVAEGIQKGWRPIVMPHVWLGVSAENQTMWNRRVKLLAETPAAVRWVSIEPILGHIWTAIYPVDWIVVGGESGKTARPTNINAIRDIVQQCRAARVPVFVKQLGAVPMIWCSQCGRQVSRGVIGGFVDMCGPTHGQMINSLIGIKSKKGGDINEWPEDLRVRQWPRGFERRD